MGILFSASCYSTVRLDGKTAVITGANTGLGKETAEDFYERGGNVILACRDLEKAEIAINDIKKRCESKKNLGTLKAIQLDLSSLKSVRKCAEEILERKESINILVNNAGVAMCPYMKTEDGYEMHFMSNHLGHFYLTLLLLPQIIKGVPARIVNVSSVTQSYSRPLDFSDLNYETRKYSPWHAYCESKLANILFTRELAKRLEENNIQGVNVYSVHPGTVATDAPRHLEKQFGIPGFTWLVHTIGSYIIKSPKQGAQTQIYCSVDENCANETGLYYTECKATPLSLNARDDEAAKKLWETSLKMVGLEDNYNPFQIVLN